MTSHFRNEGSDLTREISAARSGQAEIQVLEKPSARIGPNNGLTPPFRLRPVSQVGMQCGAGSGRVLLVVGKLVIDGLDQWKEPMPMQSGHVIT